MDEPLGALDKKLREQMQIEIKRIHRSVGTTFVYVTHDQSEALTMSDLVVVMHQGRIAQVGPPRELYDAPRQCLRRRLPRRLRTSDGRDVATRPATPSRSRWRGGTIHVSARHDRIAAARASGRVAVPPGGRRASRTAAQRPTGRC